MSQNSNARFPPSVNRTLYAVICAAALMAAEEQSDAQCQYELSVFENPVCDSGMFPRDLSESGVAVGFWRCELGPMNAFVRHPDGPVAPIPGPPDSTRSVAEGISATGLVVGNWHDGIDRSHVAFRHDGVESVTLEPLPGDDWSEAHDVATDELIVGLSLSNITGTVRAVVWDDDAVADLTPLLHSPRSLATAVNERRQVVGRRFIGQPGNITRAFLLELDTGVATDVGSIPGVSTTEAVAINNRTMVVVRGVLSKNHERRSFVWQSGQHINLGVLPDKNQTDAYDVNDRGRVVGQCSVRGNQGVPFVWHEGQLTDLNTLVPDPQGVSLTLAVATNNRGQVLAKGTRGGESVGIVLSPIDPPAGDATGDCRSDTADLLLVLAEWGPCRFCIADLNADNVVDLDDLLLVLSSWDRS